jgi:hypothetical protein
MSALITLTHCRTGSSLSVKNSDKENKKHTKSIQKGRHWPLFIDNIAIFVESCQEIWNKTCRIKKWVHESHRIEGKYMHTQEVEAGGLWVPIQPMIHRKTLS